MLENSPFHHMRLRNKVLAIGTSLILVVLFIYCGFHFCMFKINNKAAIEERSVRLNTVPVGTLNEKTVYLIIYDGDTVGAVLGE